MWSNIEVRCIQVPKPGPRLLAAEVLISYMLWFSLVALPLVRFGLLSCSIYLSRCDTSGGERLSITIPIATAWLRRSREGKMLAQPLFGEETGRTASTLEVCIPHEAVLEVEGSWLH